MARACDQMASRVSRRAFFVSLSENLCGIVDYLRKFSLRETENEQDWRPEVI